MAFSVALGINGKDCCSPLEYIKLIPTSSVIQIVLGNKKYFQNWWGFAGNCLMCFYSSFFFFILCNYNFAICEVDFLIITFRVCLFNTAQLGFGPFYNNFFVRYLSLSRQKVGNPGCAKKIINRNDEKFKSTCSRSDDTCIWVFT